MTFATSYAAYSQTSSALVRPWRQAIAPPVQYGTRRKRTLKPSVMGGGGGTKERGGKKPGGCTRRDEHSRHQNGTKMPNTISYEQTLCHNAHRMVSEWFEARKGENYGHVPPRNCSVDTKISRVSWFMSETIGAPPPFIPQLGTLRTR